MPHSALIMPPYQNSSFSFSKPHSLWSRPLSLQGRKNTESARNLCPHKVWKQAGSITSNSAMGWRADMNQLLNFLTISVIPSVKGDQCSLLQGCCEDEMRAELQNSDNWWGLLLFSGPSFASVCCVTLGKSPTLSGSPLLSLYNDVRIR